MGLSIGYIFLLECRAFFGGRPGRRPFHGVRGTPNSPVQARAQTAGPPANAAKWPSPRAIVVEIEM
jgi:hypothetical protein